MIIHATKSIRCWAEAVQVLRQALHSPQIPFKTGRYRSLQATSVLLSEVHGRWNGKGEASKRSHNETCCQKVKGRRAVRSLRKARKAHSSYRPKPRQQYPREPQTAVHKVSPTSTSKGDSVQALRKVLGQNSSRVLPEALFPLPQVGSSCLGKAQSEYRPANNFRLSCSILGNSIVPQVAAEIIRAMLESETLIPT